MIAYCDSMPPLNATDTKTPIGCRMHTLEACYGALPGAPDWYKGDDGGVLCRFGALMLAAGDIDFAELFSFAELLGIGRIEWVSSCEYDAKPRRGWEFSSHALLRCTPQKSGIPLENMKADMPLRRCFEILCESDAQFRREAQYLPWLSDMTRRRNAKMAEAFLYDDAATALITAKSGASAYLSSVAVLPRYRGKGIGLALLKEVLSHMAIAGGAVYTAAQSEPLAAFYEKAGFKALPQRLNVAEKRNLK